MAPAPKGALENALPCDDYGYKKDFRTALPQIIAVSVKNLLLLGYGMTFGFLTILIPAVKEPREGEILRLNNNEISWISSISLIVVPAGCAASGAMSAALGRRRAMQVINLPILVAWLTLHFATKSWHLYFALTLTGLAGGLLEAPVLTYVAEVTQAHLRGALSATSSMSIIFGVFTQFILGTFLYWRTIALLNISFTILAVVTLSFIPESPHWLVSKNRTEEARKSLQWLRGWDKIHNVEKELGDIQVLFHVNNEKQSENVGAFTNFKETVEPYTRRSFLAPFFLVSYAFFVGHFSGMTTLQMLKAPIDKYYATLVLGVMQLSGAAICVALVHRVGKRPLTFLSTTAGGLCCVLVAGYDGYIRNQSSSQMSIMDANATTVTNNATETENYHSSDLSWMPTTLLMMLALVTHCGIRLLPWILIGEVFSAKCRSAGAGLSSAVGYILGFLTNKIYISMVDTLFIWGTYSIYGIICLTGTLVFFYILPETEGKTLNEIENHFAGEIRLPNRVRRSKKQPNVEMSKMRELQGNVNLSFEGDFSKL